MVNLKRLREKSESPDSDESDVAGDSAGDKPDEEERDALAKSKWKNRERVMVLCSRGAPFRVRHLMADFRSLMPHVRAENKLAKQTHLTMLNELAEIGNCSSCLYFESRKHTDMYLWMSNVADGPSAKFLVHNVHTMDELRMSGNCLKASRPILSFDATFDSQPFLSLIKRLIMKIFATPDHHPRSQPFIDHVFTFSLTADHKIWFRNFQIVDDSLQLQEIGPRMVLELIRIFDGSFEGAVLYDNPEYSSPNLLRRQIKQAASAKYEMRLHVKKGRKERKAELDAVPRKDPVGEVFNTDRTIEHPKAKIMRKVIEKKKMKRKKKATKSAADKSANVDPVSASDG